MGGFSFSTTLLRKFSNSDSKLSHEGTEVSIVVASNVDDNDEDDEISNPPTVPPRTDDTNAAFAILNDDDDDVERTTAKPCAFTANINSNVTGNTANFMIIIILSSY
jgi:hypothetical protein